MCSEMVAYGLMEIRLTKPKIKINQDSSFNNQSKYAPPEEEVFERKIELTEFNAFYYVASIGDILREHLKNTEYFHETFTLDRKKKVF